ncbi:DUF2786 domain-containing protein [Vogesella urethralis]|uniref:DUF2786 domain-containing protein n=1 Tax=Vogesella urethralis TaxID=2592656 RepID=UPI0011847FCF|nr:DUF2786 domain-containing protein [Vogesella urethralis]
MQDESILRKIKKCLRLAESSNEHEAAAAIRQAQALMAKHGLSQADIAISDIRESNTKAGALTRPAKWEQLLCGLIADAFGCKAIHARQWNTAHWVFIGRDANPDIASHAFAQLYRQIKRARKTFIETQCTYLRSQTKTRRADIFCQGWLSAVSKQITQHAGERDAEVIKQYMEIKHRDIGQLGASDRMKGRKATTGDALAFHAGKATGADASLHHGINGQGSQQLVLEAK